MAKKPVKPLTVAQLRSQYVANARDASIHEPWEALVSFNEFVELARTLERLKAKDPGGDLTL